MGVALKFAFKFLLSRNLAFWLRWNISFFISKRFWTFCGRRNFSGTCYQ